jgi:linoleoyl-CoA desaturase
MRLTFLADGAVSPILQMKRRVADDFRSRGTSIKGNAVMWARTAVMLGVTFGAWGLILTNRFSPIAMLGLALVVGVGVAGIGFGIAHDALHGAYSHNRHVNRLLGLTLDLCGGSSYMWNLGHNIVHHTYTNIPGVDGDVAGSSLLRQSPEAPHRPCHRYQHLYAFPLYSLATLNWAFVKDYKDIFERHWGPQHDKVHKRPAIVSMLALKAVYYGWSLIVPLMVLQIKWWQFLIGYVAMHLTAGIILGIVFQLAHIVEGASFPLPGQDGMVAQTWLRHELATTANFSNGNRLLTWYLGGLNHQIEHHLFPRVCSVHYPRISAIVREMAASEGLPYQHEPTLVGAIRSHYRLLKHLGQGPAGLSLEERRSRAA